MNTSIQYTLITLLVGALLAHASDTKNPNEKTEADHPVPPLQSLTLPEAPSPVPGYRLRWADEFNGGKVNEDWWWYRVGGKGPRSERASQVDIVSEGNNGFLRIRNQKVKEGGKTVYLGGGLITKFQMRYGYFETRVKMGQKGWHEAFWTSISNFQKGDDAYPFSRDHERMEVDCFEHFASHDRAIVHGFHRWKGNKSNKKEGKWTHSKSLSDDFHTFGFEYTPKHLIIHIDGKKVKTYDISEATRNWFFLIISSIKQSKGDAIDGEVLWDYVRYYEPEPLK
jgi:beta-glucanase (GH16 family)